MQRIVRDAAIRGGIHKPVTPHWLRHSAATHALNRGCPPSLVRDSLGHSNIRTTDIYLHSDPKEGLGKYLPQ